MHTSYLLAWALPIAAAESCYSIIAKTHTFTSTVTTVQFTTLANEGCPVNIAQPTALVPVDDALLSPTYNAEKPIPTKEVQQTNSASHPVNTVPSSVLDYPAESSTTNPLLLPTPNPTTIITAITPSIVHTMPADRNTDSSSITSGLSDNTPQVPSSAIQTARPSAALPEAPSIITTAITPSLVNPEPSLLSSVQSSGQSTSELVGTAQPTITTAITPSVVQPSPYRSSTNIDQPILTSVGPSKVATGIPTTITTAITPSLVKALPSQSVVQFLPLDDTPFAVVSDTPSSGSLDIKGEDTVEEDIWSEASVHIRRRRAQFSRVVR